jgi:CRISPR-associated protein Cst1
MIGSIMHGIVGFLRILNENQNDFTIRRNNYIEFDTEDLRDFHKYYFNYFFKKYNVAENVENRIRNSFEYLENNIEIVWDDKEREKERKDKIKFNKKYIKEVIKKQLDKIKKIDENTYEEMKEQYDRIDKVAIKQEIIEITEKLISNIKKDNINNRLTLNLFKSILSNTYYGQPSFLNVVKTALSYEEQQEVMYKDYISNIVETGFINDIMQNKYDIEQIKEYIENAKKSNITKDIEKIYSKIEKSKTIEDIQKYLKEKVIKRCSMCENEIGLTTNYSEGNFVPLAISSDNARNFFWNQNVKMPICDICKLILFCIPAGMTTITKTIKENGEYREKQILSFVNYDTGIERLYKTNINFGNKSRYENRNGNPYSELILDIVEQDKQVSMWQLENIFVVELEAEYGAYSRIEYFNIKRYMSLFFKDYAQKTLSKIWDYRYRLQIVDYIMKNKDIKYTINDRLRDEIKKGEKKNGYNSFLATQTRMILNVLKKEGKEVDDIKKNNDKLYVIYNLGVQIHSELKSKGEDNKLDGYTYKMLNSIKAGNKKEFMDIVIRLHIAMGKDVSPIFIEIMQTTGLDFESIGHSFLAGLISNKYEKKEEEKIDG